MAETCKRCAGSGQIDYTGKGAIAACPDCYDFSRPLEELTGDAPLCDSCGHVTNRAADGRTHCLNVSCTRAQ